MEGGLAVCTADFFSVNKIRKLHFKFKCLRRQKFGRCLLVITLRFDRLVFLCSGTDITHHLLTLG